MLKNKHKKARLRTSLTPAKPSSKDAARSSAVADASDADQGSPQQTKVTPRPQTAKRSRSEAIEESPSICEHESPDDQDEGGDRDGADNTTVDPAADDVGDDGDDVDDADDGAEEWTTVEKVASQMGGAGEIIVPFKNLGIAPWLVECCDAMGIRKPSPVQRACIPPILRGEDVLGCAPTGAGKTATFALPILQRLSTDPFGVFALVLTPTRELAFQIIEQFRAFGSPIRLRDCLVVGGLDVVKQSVELSKSPHVVVATPGRLAEVMKYASLQNLRRLKFLVLDEADRLLEPGFADDLSFIMDHINPNRQTLLFSATITPNIEALETVLSKKAIFKYKQELTAKTVEKLKQMYLLVPEMVKEQYFVQLVQEFGTRRSHRAGDDAKGGRRKRQALESAAATPTASGEFQQALVFVNSCRTCEFLHEMLKDLELDSVQLHSRMSQLSRTNALSRFKSGLSRLLIATDVASRGLDIPQVQLVVNYDMPRTVDDYIHRVGRTARAGRGGRAASLLTQYQVQWYLEIESKIGIKMDKWDADEKLIESNMKTVVTAKRSAKMRMSDNGRWEILSARKATKVSSSS